MKKATLIITSESIPDYKEKIVLGVIETGYPIIRITKQIIGKVKQRVIGYVKEGTYIDINLYEAILTDSKTNKIWSYKRCFCCLKRKFQ